MDIIAFYKTLAVLLTVIRCQFAEEMFQYAVVDSRIDLYCETEFDVDWFFTNQTNRTNRYSIYAEKSVPQPHVARYSVTVKSNQTAILSAEKVDSTYAGTYECEKGYPRHVLKSIRLIIITPTLCNANGNVYAVGNTSHELYCSFSVDRNNSSDDRWPTELCANGAQWHCQILSSHTDVDPLYFGCSANAKLFTDHALNEGRPSLLINASHQCASTSPENASTSTISALMTSSYGDKQIIIVVCAVVGFNLLTILAVAMLTKRRNCWNRRPRGRTNNTHKIENDPAVEDQPEAIYHSIDDCSEFEIDRSTEGQHYTSMNRRLGSSPEFEIGRSTEEHSYTSINRRLEGAPAYVEIVL